MLAPKRSGRLVGGAMNSRCLQAVTLQPSSSGRQAGLASAHSFENESREFHILSLPAI